jgi:hypothetical protein
MRSHEKPREPKSFGLAKEEHSVAKPQPKDAGEQLRTKVNEVNEGGTGGEEVRNSGERKFGLDHSE